MVHALGDAPAVGPRFPIKLLIRKGAERHPEIIGYLLDLCRDRCRIVLQVRLLFRVFTPWEILPLPSPVSLVQYASAHAPRVSSSNHRGYMSQIPLMAK